MFHERPLQERRIFAVARNPNWRNRVLNTTTVVCCKVVLCALICVRSDPEKRFFCPDETRAFVVCFASPGFVRFSSKAEAAP